jgi:hypothetical protein
MEQHEPAASPVAKGHSSGELCGRQSCPKGSGEFTERNCWLACWFVALYAKALSSIGSVPWNGITIAEVAQMHTSPAKFTGRNNMHTKDK